MHRRKFLIGTGLTALTAFSGCTASASPPPRKSNVVEKISVVNGELRIDVANQTWVKSRYSSSNSAALIGPSDVGVLNAVGVASAKGKGGGGGKGATGRGTGGYSRAPKIGRGRAWWHGGGYADDWYEENAEQVNKYSVGIAALGIAYLGSNAQFQDDKPGSGPVPWDKLFANPSDVETYSIPQEGWYRVGAHIEGEQVNHDFGWECIDLEIEDNGSGYSVSERWKVSPRI